METPPLHIVLEVTRSKGAQDPSGYPLEAREYQLRHDDDTIDTAVFPWSDGLRGDLASLGMGRSEPQAVQRVGNTLQGFFISLGWRRYETQIRAALRARAPVHLTIRSKAEEIAALPLDALTLEPEGLAFGRTPGCHLSLEWPGATSVAAESSPGGARILFAWSAAGGLVPAAEHMAELRQLAGGPRGGDDAGALVEEVPGASLEALSSSLARIRESGRAVGVLHLLCHGGRLPGPTDTFGLWLGSSRQPEEAVLVDPVAFEACLAPHAGLIQSVLLFACDGGNTGGGGNILGSVAQRLHRIGIPVVVASRFPLTAAGSTAFTAGFYRELIRGRPLLGALAAGRHRLSEDVRSTDWLALQVWARRTEDLNRNPFDLAPRPENDAPPSRSFRGWALLMAFLVVGVAVACTTLLVRGDAGPERTSLDGGKPAAPPDAGDTRATDVQPKPRAPDRPPAAVAPVGCGHKGDLAPTLELQRDAYHEEIRAGLERCPGDSCNAAIERCLGTVHFRLAMVELKRKDLSSARDSAEESIRWRRALAGEGAGLSSRLDLVESELLSAKVERAAGAVQRAREHHEQAAKDLEEARSDGVRQAPDRFNALNSEIDRFHP